MSVVTPISSRESAETKGRRYLTEGRLSLRVVSGNMILADCRGDQGNTYGVGYHSDKGDWDCTCEARGRCSHIVALSLVVKKPK